MNEYSGAIFHRSRPLRGTDDLSDLIDVLKDKRIVMLGEASHGTSEFYDWRRRISLELIQHYGFDFIAVEGDWPPCERVNRFLKSDEMGDVFECLKSFDRWPTWMWANLEFAQFLVDLKKLNLERKKKVSFHGLDVYSLMDSISEVLESLTLIDTKLADQVKEKYACLRVFRHDEKDYARSLFLAPEGCEKEVLAVWKMIRDYKLMDRSKEYQLLDAEQNARVVKNAEFYFRTMVSIDDNSWNVRDRHMMETLETLLGHHGNNSKAIIWEHNTHIGDYRGTDMVLQGQINLGGLAREKFGEKDVALVGFGTYAGTVLASHSWDGPIQTLPVPEARRQSLEALLHDLTDSVGSSDYYFLLDPNDHASPLFEFKGHRAIGVVYHPDFDRRGNYVPTSLSKRYDAFIFLDETHALTPLTVGFDPRKLPESYPYGSRL